MQKTICQGLLLDSDRYLVLSNGEAVDQRGDDLRLACE